MGNEIIIRGQKIDISKLSDEQIVKLYTELEERELTCLKKELICDEKILELEEKIENLKQKM